MASEFGLDYGLIHEAVVTGRKIGAGKEFWTALAHNEELFRKVVAFVAEALKTIFKLVSTINRDMTGWKCVDPVPVEEDEFEPVLLEFLQPNEVFVNGEEMVKRAKKQGAHTSLRHLEAMLREQDKIPAEWRKFLLISPEVWLSPDGNRGVFYLSWRGERWYLDYDWLDFDFYSRSRLVAPRK